MLFLTMHMYPTTYNDEIRMRKWREFDYLDVLWLQEFQSFEESGQNGTSVLVTTHSEHVAIGLQITTAYKAIVRTYKEKT